MSTQYSVGGAAPARLPHGALENRVQHQHCHIAADTVALAGDAGESRDYSLTKTGLKSIELQYVGPCGEVGVPAAGEDGSVQSHERCGIVGSVVGGALNEVLRMFGDPRVIGRDVIGHEVEEEPQAAVREFLARRGETVRTAEMPVNLIAADAVGRADIVFRTEVGKGALEIREQAWDSYWRWRSRQGCAPTLP